MMVIGVLFKSENLSENWRLYSKNKKPNERIGILKFRNICFLRNRKVIVQIQSDPSVGFLPSERLHSKRIMNDIFLLVSTR